MTIESTDAKGEQEFCELTSKNDVCARYNLLKEWDLLKDLDELKIWKFNFYQYRNILFQFTKHVTTCIFVKKIPTFFFVRFITNL